MSEGDSNKPPPTGWAENDLAGYLTQGQENAWAIYANSRPHFMLLSDIHDSYQLLLAEDNVRNSPQMLEIFLTNRSHSAFLSASRLSLSAEIPNAYQAIRLSLEYALYGLLIHKNPSLKKPWLERHDSDDARRKVRREFQVSRMLALLRTMNQKLAEDVESLYELTIDLGAHPNVYGVLGNIEQSQSEDGLLFSTQYMVGEGRTLDVGLMDTAKAGMLGLRLASIYLPRARILGVPERISSHDRALVALSRAYLKKYSTTPRQLLP